MHVVLVKLGKDKRRLVLRELIVYVNKTCVLVLMVLKQLERLVLHIVLTPVSRALVITTKRIVPVVPVWFVELGKDKRLLVLRELIVYVLIAELDNINLPTHLQVLTVLIGRPVVLEPMSVRPEQLS